jgi:serine/threonine protein kinase/predicted esterase
MKSAGDRQVEIALLEELVARSLELSEGAPSAATLASVCAGRPELLPAVHARLAALERAGLLGQGVLGSPSFPGYRVLYRLGAGGMAVVYAAREEATGALVALKTADPRLGHSERALNRFRREMEVAQRLSHPRLVAVRAVGAVEGVPFYAMDFISGATLGELLDELRARALPASALSVEVLASAFQARRAGEGAPAAFESRTYVEAVARIVLDVAEALEHVHANGIVHRDVKPSNVLVDAAGHGNLFDLGLAHLTDDGRLTRTGDFAGSPHYASPEQVEGSPEALDARADVYGLGATLFELIALRPPFQAKSTPELLRRILKEEAPSLRQVAPHAPRELEALCRTCLEKEPRHRYASAAELALDLRRFLSFQPVSARPVGLARRGLRFARRNPAQALALALGATLVLGTPAVLFEHSRRIAAQRDRVAAAAAEARREAEENREVSLFLESLILGLDDPLDPEHTAVLHGLVDEARARVGAGDGIHPLTRASLFHTVARVLAGMGRAAEAMPLLDRSFAIRAAELGEEHPETAETVQELAALHLALGNAASASALAERGLSVDPSLSPVRSRALETLGRVALGEGRLDEAEQLLDEALEALRDAQRETPAARGDEARLLRGLAELALARGAGERAEDLALGAEELVRSAPEPALADLAEGARLLAVAAEARGRAEEALQRWDEVLHLEAKRGRALGAASLAALERLAALEGERLGMEATQATLRAAFEHAVLLGENRGAVGLPGAEAAFGRALELAARLDDPDPDLRGRAHLGRGRALATQGLHAAAGADLGEARAIGEPGHAHAAWMPEVFLLLARGASAQGAGGALEDALDGARAWFEARLEAGADRRLCAALERHALLLFDLGRGVEAEPFLRAAESLRLEPEAEAVGIELAPADARAFDDQMQHAVTLLQADLAAEAAPVLERCIALRPQDAIAHYNHACALAGLADKDGAFAALERALAHGYAYREGALALIAQDADLEPLRADARFEALLARMRALAERAEAYAAMAAEYVPPGVDPAAGAPLLVVLHKSGATKEEVVTGPWRAVAEELGCVLLAPSGRIPAGAEPEEGMLWVDSLSRYAAKTWYYEKPVRDALAAHRRRYPGAGEPVWIAGEELGGTLAFHLALRSPEVYRGCLMVASAVPLELAADLEPRLAALGLRVALLADPAESLAGAPAGRTTPEYLAATLRELGSWGLETSFRALESGTDPAFASKAAAALRFLESGARD